LAGERFLKPRFAAHQQGPALLNRQRREQPPAGTSWIGGEGPRLVGSGRTQMRHTLQAPQRKHGQGEQRRCQPSKSNEIIGSPLKAPVLGPVLARRLRGSLAWAAWLLLATDGWNRNFLNNKGNAEFLAR